MVSLEINIMNLYFLMAGILFIVIVILVYFNDKRRHPEDEGFNNISTAIGIVLGIIFIIYALIVS